MNVSHNNIDQLNAIVTIEIEKADYADKVKNRSVLMVIKPTSPASVVDMYLMVCW